MCSLQASRRAKKLKRQATVSQSAKDMLREIKATIDEDGDGDLSCCERVRACQAIRRTYLKLPLLRCTAWLRHLDHYWRVFFPCFFVPYILTSLAYVKFGQNWMDLSKDATSLASCVNRGSTK